MFYNFSNIKLKNKLQKFVLFWLLFIKYYVILANVGNEDKQMWFATFNPWFESRVRRWCYDRSYFVRNNISTFIWLCCRNYYSICLSYTGYNFKQIDNKKNTSVTFPVRCVFLHINILNGSTKTHYRAITEQVCEKMHTLLQVLLYNSILF